MTFTANMGKLPDELRDNPSAMITVLFRIETELTVPAWVCNFDLMPAEPDIRDIVGWKYVEVASEPYTDPVNHPKHYTSHPSGIECIQITRHMSNNIGNAIKYLWRADLKGAPIRDLEKAVFYIQDEIKKREAE